VAVEEFITKEEAGLMPGSSAYFFAALRAFFFLRIAAIWFLR
jgi:hypothetical protein